MAIEGELTDGSRFEHEFTVQAPEEIKTLGVSVVSPASVVAGEDFEVECLSILDEGFAQDIGNPSTVHFGNEVTRLPTGSYVATRTGELEVVCESDVTGDLGRSVTRVAPAGAADTRAMVDGASELAAVAGQRLAVTCVGRDRYGNATATGGVRVHPHFEGGYESDGDVIRIFRAGAYEIRCQPQSPGGEVVAATVVVGPDEGSAVWSVAGLSAGESIGLGETRLVAFVATDVYGNAVDEGRVEDARLWRLDGEQWVTDSSSGVFAATGSGSLSFRPPAAGNFRAEFRGSPTGSRIGLPTPFVEIEVEVDDGRDDSVIVPGNRFEVEYPEPSNARMPVCVSPVHGRALSQDEADLAPGGREYIGPEFMFEHELWNVGLVRGLEVSINGQRLVDGSVAICNEAGRCLGVDTDVLDCGSLLAALENNEPGSRCAVEGEFDTQPDLNALEIRYYHTDALSEEWRWSTLACSNAVVGDWADSATRDDFVPERPRGSMVSETRLYQGAFDHRNFGEDAPWQAVDALNEVIRSDSFIHETTMAIRELHPGFGRFEPANPEASQVAISLEGFPVLYEPSRDVNQLSVHFGSVEFDFGGGPGSRKHTNYCYTASVRNLTFTYDFEFWGAVGVEPSVTLQNLSSGGNEIFAVPEVEYEFSARREWDRHARQHVVCKSVGNAERERRVDLQVNRLARQIRTYLRLETAEIDWSAVLRAPEVTEFPAPTGIALELEGHVPNRIRAQSGIDRVNAVAGLLSYSVIPAGISSRNGDDNLLHAYRGALWAQEFVVPAELMTMRDSNDPVLQGESSVPRSLRERTALVQGLPLTRAVRPALDGGQISVMRELQQTNSILSAVWRLGAFHYAQPAKRSLDVLVGLGNSTDIDMNISLENPPRFIVDANGAPHIEITGALIEIVPSYVASGELLRYLETFGSIKIRLSARLPIDLGVSEEGTQRVSFVRTAEATSDRVFVGSNEWSAIELLSNELALAGQAERNSGIAIALQDWLVAWVADAVLAYASQSTGGTDSRTIQFGDRMDQITIELSTLEGRTELTSSSAGATLVDHLGLRQLFTPHAEYE